MANVNLEVLKQALDHFAEQEALAESEVKNAELRIEELKQRIQDCHERLKTVEHDRDRVMEIMQRYATKSKTEEAPKAAKEIKETKAEPKVEAKVATEAKGSAKPIKEIPKPTSPKAGEKKEEKPQTEPEAAEGEDETVKNINDALRGLFR